MYKPAKKHSSFKLFGGTIFVFFLCIFVVLYSTLFRENCLVVVAVYKRFSIKKKRGKNSHRKLGTI